MKKILKLFLWLFLKNVRIRKISGFRFSADCGIGANCVFDARCGIELKGENMISPNCTFVSYSGILEKKGKIVLEKGSCVGSNSVVLPGVTIGKNSVVGALSLVNKDIPSGEIWVGSPIRFLRKLKKSEYVCRN